MKITREQLRTIVGEVLQEEKDYQSFFKAMLKKHGVSSPDEFKSDEEKKSFFNKVEDAWKGVSERLQSIKEDELTAKQQKIDLNKNGKVDGDDLSKLRAGTKTEAELSAAQQKIDLNKNGKVDGSDLSKLRAGAKTEGEMETSTSLTKILSKEGETLVKSGAGKMYNITKVNEGAKPTIKVVNNLKNEEGIQIVVTKTTDGDTMYGGFVVRGKLQKMIPVGANDSKEGVKKRALQIWDEFGKQLGENKKINEGKYDADLDKIEAAVKNASSFMSVGAELKKAGIKYDFTTSMIPMYMIKVSGNTIAVVNKKYAAGAEREVKDIAIGLLN
jgi:hypothetical protein